MTKRFLISTLCLLLSLAPAGAMLSVNNLSGFGSRPVPVSITNTASAEDAVDRTTYTFSSQAIGSSADDRDVVVGVFWADGDAGTLSSATIEGGAATIDVQRGTNGSSIQSGAAIIRRRVTTTSTTDIVLNFSGSPARASIDVYRVVGAKTTLAHSDGAQGTTSPQSISLNVPAEGGAIATAGDGNSTGAGTITWTGLTEDTDRTVENANNAHSSAHDEFAAEQVGLTVQADASGGADQGLSLVGISFSTP